jgi:hypothetical protein
MRRIILALFAMSVGTTLLVGLKSQGLGLPFQLAAEGPVDPAEGAVPGATGDGEPTAGAEPTTGVGPTEAAGPSAAATAAAEPGATTAPATTTLAPPPNPAPGVSGTFTGGAVAVRTAQSPNTKSRLCGDCHDYATAVTITISNGKITNVSVSYTTSPSQSQRYADKASNTLRPKLLSAQTWRLGPVSGATYSANAFELSVKDAMAKAGLPT